MSCQTAMDLEVYMQTTIDQAQTNLPLYLTPDEVQELIKQYAANPVFRSATADELVVTDNPYRRPVRPQDLEFLDYRTPLAASEVLDLRSLIGHRMLRNIYEAELLFLPKGPDPAIWQDFERFYSVENQMLGDRARPALETILFSFLGEDGAASAPESAAVLVDGIRMAYQRAQAAQSQII